MDSTSGIFTFMLSVYCAYKCLDILTLPVTRRPFRVHGRRKVIGAQVSSHLLPRTWSRLVRGVCLVCGHSEAHM